MAKSKKPLGVIHHLPADDPRSMLSENGKARLDEMWQAVAKSLADKAYEAVRFGNVQYPTSLSGLCWRHGEPLAKSMRTWLGMLSCAPKS